MIKQDLKPMFDDLKENNDYGAREYRVAEYLAPMVGTVAPTDNALFIGQEYVDTAAGEKYFSVATGTGASDWQKLTNAV